MQSPIKRKLYCKESKGAFILTFKKCDYQNKIFYITKKVKNRFF